MDVNLWLRYGTMEGLQTLLTYRENIVNLEKEVHDAMMKLQQQRWNVYGEMRRSKGPIEKLRELFMKVIQEKEEARNRIQILQQGISPSNPAHLCRENPSVSNHVYFQPCIASNMHDVSNRVIAGHRAENSRSAATLVSARINDYGPYGQNFQMQMLLARGPPLLQARNPSIELHQRLTAYAASIHLGYLKSIIVLKKKLHETTLQLQSLHEYAKEEMKKNEEEINNLLWLIQHAAHERDVAKIQLQILLQKFTLSPNSHIMFPVEFLNAASQAPTNFHTSDLCTIGQLQQQNFVDRDANSSMVSPDVSDHSHRLPMNKDLPERGMLLQPVTDAGQELQKLLSSAEPLSQQRSPPPLLQLLPTADVLSQKRKRE